MKPASDHRTVPHPADSSATEQYARLLKLRWVFMAGIAFIIVLSMAADITFGPAGLGWQDLYLALTRPEAMEPTNSVILLDFRLPYAVMAVVVGMALGLAGAEMQTILNNPLASPFTLGISSAAAFGASLAIVLDWGLPGLSPEWVIGANAFVFAILSALMLDAMARWGAMSGSGMVLVGIALVFSFNALVSLMQYIASAEDLQNLVFWTLGSLSRASWPKIGLMALVIALILPLTMKDAWKLTALRLGEDRAASFGIDVKRLRLISLLRISFLAAVAVSMVGTISFIGLIAPHIARRIFGEDHRYYLPGSALIGAMILSLASIASKNIASGTIVPVGIVTSLVGVPFFISVVMRRKAG